MEKKPDRQAPSDVARLVAGHKLRCLGATQAGQPRDPLYVADKELLARWAPPA